MTTKPTKPAREQTVAHDPEAWIRRVPRQTKAERKAYAQRRFGLKKCSRCGEWARVILMEHSECEDCWGGDWV